VLQLDAQAMGAAHEDFAVRIRAQGVERRIERGERVLHTLFTTSDQLIGVSLRNSDLRVQNTSIRNRDQP
jgi:hypothetical protein